MKPSVYLAGLISTDYPESLAWRETAQGLLEPEFKVLTPLRDKHNLQHTTPDGGLTSLQWTSKSIILRDRADVEEATVILAHLENFGSPRPLLGTIYELGWAWELNKPVVAIAAADNYLMRRHPFVAETVSFYAETLLDAVPFVRYFAR